MEMILLKDVETIGRKGDMVRVRDGYARNFLIPQGLALTSTKANQVFIEEQKARAAKRREKETAEAEKVAKKLNDLKIVIESAAGEKDKLFGAVTAEDICEAVNKKGYKFSRKQIHLKEAIKTLGDYPVTIEIYPQVKATVQVEVVKKS